MANKNSNIDSKVDFTNRSFSIGDNISHRIHKLKRDALESLYWHTINVYENTYVVEEDSGISIPGYHLIIENEPCRVTSQVTDPTSNNPKEFYKRIAVMLRPELDIPPGCKFEVNYNGKTDTYRQSSEARKFSDHQTIELMVYTEEEQWA